MFASRELRRGSRYTVEVAFTDRAGGASTGPYASLDLTRERPGATAELAVNRSRLAEALGVEGLVTMRQVHGADVRHVQRLEPDPPTCDGLVTTTPGLALCVRAADCVPLVLADVASVRHAERAVAAGADGLVLLTAGAGGQTGWLNPFAFVRAVRAFFDGPLVLAVATIDDLARRRGRMNPRLPEAWLCYLVSVGGYEDEDGCPRRWLTGTAWGARWPSAPKRPLPSPTGACGRSAGVALRAGRADRPDAHHGEP